MQGGGESWGCQQSKGDGTTTTHHIWSKAVAVVVESPRRKSQQYHRQVKFIFSLLLPIVVPVEVTAPLFPPLHLILRSGLVAAEHLPLPLVSCHSSSALPHHGHMNSPPPPACSTVTRDTTNYTTGAHCKGVFVCFSLSNL